MEINKALQTVVNDLALQPLELMPSVAYNRTLQKALLAPKVSEAPNEDLATALRYAMMITGIRAANMPIQEDFDFIKDWTRRNFPHLTTDEIKIAFDMAASGRLTLEKNETAQAYENFSCEYLGRILKAYRGWAEKERQYIPINEKPALPPPQANWQPIWEDILQSARDGSLETKIIGEPVYQWLTETGILKLTTEDKQALFVNAKNKYRAELSDDLYFRNAAKVFEAERELEAIDNGKIEGDLYLKIAIRAKISAVKIHALETVKKEKG
jgi:hypothetical protein